jgi:uncharacterized Ntn-hydrolase superfamily protein
MRSRPILLLFLLVSGCATPGGDASPPPRVVATFSIVAWDPATGDLGVAVQSRFLGVGAVVPWARAGVGAVATQAFANTTYGPRGLDLLASGLAPAAVVKTLTEADEGRAFRQLGIVDAKGRASSFTGEKANAWAGHVVGEGFACQGNILAGEAVVSAMAKAYRESKEALPERLVAALSAGQSAGGDKRGRQSAALLVVRKGGGYAGFNDRYLDLHIEDHPTPIEELARVLALHRRTFGVPPAPGELARFEMEAVPDGGPTSTPRAAWASFVRLFGARDYVGLYAIHTKSYRSANPFETWKATMEKNAEGIASFLARAKYAGTLLEGETGKVAVRMPGSPRPHVTALRREDGEWRFDE